MRRYITGLGLVILLIISSVSCRRVDNDDTNKGDDQVNIDGGRPGGMAGMNGGRPGGMNGGGPGGMPGMMGLLAGMQGMGSMMGMNGRRPGGMAGMSGERPGDMAGMNGERPGDMAGMNGERPDVMAGMNGGRPGGMNGGGPGGMPGMNMMELLAGMQGMGNMMGMNGGRPGGMAGMNGGRPGGMAGMNGGRPGGMTGMNGRRPGGMAGMNGGRPSGMVGMNGGRPGGMASMNGGRPGGMRGGRPGGMAGMRGGRPGGMAGMNGGRPGGMAGMNGGKPGGMAGMNSGRPGGMAGMNGGRPGGMAGMNGGRPGGMRGMNGGRPGGIRRMNGGRPGGMGGRKSSGNTGNGGGTMTMSRADREKMKAEKRARLRKRKQVIEERKRKQDQNKITYLVNGMINFTSSDYDKDSTMMKLYMGEYNDVVSILGKRRDIVMNKMRVANLGGQARTSITLGSFKHTKKVSDKWNRKCLSKFEELVDQFGENPTGKDFNKAKAILKRVTGNYIKEVKKMFDELSQKVDSRDQGYVIDDIKPDAGNARKKEAMILDVRKISASLGCAIQEKKIDLEPYHSRDHKPTAAEVHLMKRLGSVRMNALDTFMGFQKETMAELTPDDRTLPIDIEMIRNGLKSLEEKKDELLKKAIQEMKQIYDEEQVDPELRPLKEKLSEIAQKLFEEEKDSRSAQLKAIMDDVIGQVGDRSGAGTLEGLLRRRSIKELAGIQHKIGSFVNQVVKRYAKTGGSLEQKVAKASAPLKSHVLKVMDKALEHLKQFGARNVKALKQGKGIFGRLNQLHKNRKQ